MQQSSGSRDTALKKRRIGSVPSPAMALSNLVPVKKEQKQRNEAKRHQGHPQASQATLPSPETKELSPAPRLEAITP